MARVQRMSLLTLSAHRTRCEQPSDTIHDELRFMRFRKWAGVTKVCGFASGAPHTCGQDHVNARAVGAEPLRQCKAVHQPRHVDIAEDNVDLDIEMRNALSGLHPRSLIRYPQARRYSLITILIRTSSSITRIVCLVASARLTSATMIVPPWRERVHMEELFQHAARLLKINVDNLSCP